MSRKCRRCGTIEYGIWGPIALLGYSMLICALGYILSDIYFSESIPVLMVVFGIILWSPMFFISYHENKENKKESWYDPTYGISHGPPKETE